MTDIVVLLRSGPDDWNLAKTEADMNEAAKEIERLRADVERLRMALENVYYEYAYAFPLDTLTMVRTALKGKP